MKVLNRFLAFLKKSKLLSIRTTYFILATIHNVFFANNKVTKNAWLSKLKKS